MPIEWVSSKCKQCSNVKSTLFDWKIASWLLSIYICIYINTQRQCALSFTFKLSKFTHPKCCSVLRMCVNFCVLLLWSYSLASLFGHLLVPIHHLIFLLFELCMRTIHMYEMIVVTCNIFGRLHVRNYIR